jgi:hypothetical protein
MVTTILIFSLLAISSFCITRLFLIIKKIYVEIEDINFYNVHTTEQNIKRLRKDLENNQQLIEWISFNLPKFKQGDVVGLDSSKAIITRCNISENTEREFTWSYDLQFIGGNHKFDVQQNHIYEWKT